MSPKHLDVHSLYPSTLPSLSLLLRNASTPYRKHTAYVRFGERCENDALLLAILENRPSPSCPLDISPSLVCSGVLQDYTYYHVSTWKVVRLVPWQVLATHQDGLPSSSEHHIAPHGQVWRMIRCDDPEGWWLDGLEAADITNFLLLHDLHTIG